MLWLGIDVGGTFTDLVLFDLAARELKVLKTPSTPKNQADGILAGIDRLGLTPERLERVVHGTTVATNTALERERGAREGARRRVGAAPARRGRGRRDSGALRRRRNRSGGGLFPACL